MQEKRFMVASVQIQQNRDLLPEPELSNRSAKRQELNGILKECFGDRFVRFYKSIAFQFIRSDSFLLFAWTH